jgi:fido (protein-threonine AMPylation protein)
MNLQETQLQIYQLRQQMTLTLDNSKSVKLQVKNINLIQKQLKAIKKEVSLTIKEINQQATQTTPDSLISVGLDLFGKRKWAGQMRQITRREIQSEKISLRQP